MAEGLQHHRGGILGLLAYAEHPHTGKALEADLLRVGLRLRWVGDGVHDFTWRDLGIFISEAGTETALYRVSNPDWMWDQTTMLLADAVDSLRILIWQKTEDAQNKRNQPKPIPRPGVEGPKKKQLGTGVPLDQIKARMDAVRARATADREKRTRSNQEEVTQ